MSTQPFNSHYFDVIDTPEKAYWIGFLWGKATITEDEDKGFVFKLKVFGKGKEMMSKFTEAIESTIPLKIETSDYYNEDGLMQMLTISDQHFVRILLEKYRVGLFKGDIDPLIKNIPKEFNREFFRGLVDGGGYMQTKAGQKRGNKQPPIYATIRWIGTSALLGYINEALIQEGLTETRYAFTKIYPNSDYDWYSLTITGNIKALQILNWLYGEGLEPAYNYYVFQYEKLKERYEPKPEEPEEKSEEPVEKKPKEKEICRIKDCEKAISVQSQGVCPMHYQRFRKYGSYELPPKQAHIEEMKEQVEKETKEKLEPSFKVNPDDFYCIEASQEEYQMIQEIARHLRESMPTVEHPLLGTIKVKYDSGDALRYALRMAHKIITQQKENQND